MTADQSEFAEIADEGQVPAAQAVAGRLQRALSVIEGGVPLVLADQDPEDLHKLRVAVRRSRALLKALGAHLPAKTVKRGQRGLRWLGKVTTPTRDLDVFLAGDAKRFSSNLQSRLQSERTAEWEAMAAALQSDRFVRLCRRWRKALEQVEAEGPPFRPAADAALLAAAERFIGAARALTADSPPEALHALRKDGKKLRYLLEFVRGLHPSTEVKALIIPVKQAQDALGHYQDLTAHRWLLSRHDEARPFLEALAAAEPERRGAAMEALAPFRRAGALDAYREMTGRSAQPVLRSLVLWRHAKSDWDDSTLPDIERPLAARGHKAAPSMATWLAKNWPPDSVLCSPARRTAETWGHLAGLLPEDVPVRFDARAYLADPHQLCRLIAATPAEAETLLLIGHNPGLEALAAELAEAVDGKFATAAAAVLQFTGCWTDLTPGKAKLVTFRKPKR